MGNKRYNVQPRRNDRANERSADLMCPTGNELDEDEDDDTYNVFEETPIDEELKLNSSNIQFYNMNNVSVCYDYKLFLLFENRNTH